VTATDTRHAAGKAWTPDPGAVIQADALTLRYTAKIIALDELTVKIAPGITGLIGANGAGKSTLIKILLGLLPPTAGHAAVLGRDCVTSGYEIRTLTGYMPEHDCLPPDMSATELVTHLGRMSGLPATAARERAADSLRHVGLYEERYRQIGTYSTGMKQRVKLAQALVGDPRLLLLDEPAAGLDRQGLLWLGDTLARLRDNGTTVIMSTHARNESLDLATRAVALAAGRVERDSGSGGDPRPLLAALRSEA